jgi:hypothetical protein
LVGIRGPRGKGPSFHGLRSAACRPGTRTAWMYKACFPPSPHTWATSGIPTQPTTSPRRPS